MNYRIKVEADPGEIKENEKSEITATVWDEDGVRVKELPVAFTVYDDVGKDKLEEKNTDDQGQANQITFKPESAAKGTYFEVKAKAGGAEEKAEIKVKNDLDIELEGIEAEIENLELDLTNARTAVSKTLAKLEELQESKRIKRQQQIEDIMLDYEKEYKKNKEAADRHEGTLKLERDLIEADPDVNAEQREKIKTRLSDLDQVVRKKKATCEELDRESKKREQDEINAEAECRRQKLIDEQTKQETRESRKEVKARLSQVETKLNELPKDKPLKAYADILVLQTTMEAARSQMDVPDDLRKKLEDGLAASAEAKQNWLEIEGQKAEKYVEKQQARDALLKARTVRVEIIEHFVKSLAR